MRVTQIVIFLAWGSSGARQIVPMATTRHGLSNCTSGRRPVWRCILDGLHVHYIQTTCSIASWGLNSDSIVVADRRQLLVVILSIGAAAWSNHEAGVGVVNCRKLEVGSESWVCQTSTDQCSVPFPFLLLNGSRASDGRLVVASIRWMWRLRLWCVIVDV